MSSATIYRAFHGDPALQASMVGRVREKWTQGQVFPLPYMKWRTNGGMVSLSGALAETQVPEQFIERTGLPVELATLCEGLVYVGAEFIEDKSRPSGIALRGSDDLLSFALEWLDAIALGADLGEVVPRFMHSFLASVLATDFAMAAHLSDTVRASAERILDLWQRELSGMPAGPREWRSLRADILQSSTDHRDPWGYALDELVESLAWPARGLAPEFVPIFQVFFKEVRQFLLAPYLSGDDRDILMQSSVGLRELTRALRNPQLQQLPTETLLARDPQSKPAVLAFMQPEMQARINAIKPKTLPESNRMLRAHMDRLRGFIETAGRSEASAP